ncbi:hypothetical protein AB4581_11390 [Vibrio cyclitrophicus]
MKKTVLLLGAIAISTNCSAVQETLQVTTIIDINKLYVDSITNVVFEPSELNLDINHEETAFNDQFTTLKISTDIPKEVSNVSYTSTLTNNESFCSDYSGNDNLQNDFVSIKFDGKLLNVGDSVALADFNSDDGTNKYSEHGVEFSFRPFTEIVSIGVPKECSGEIKFLIGVGI